MRASPFFVSSVTSSTRCCATSDTLKIQRGAVTPVTIHIHSAIIHCHDHVVWFYCSEWNSCKPAVDKKKKKVWRRTWIRGEDSRYRPKLLHQLCGCISQVGVLCQSSWDFSEEFSLDKARTKGVHSYAVAREGRVSLVTYWADLPSSFSCSAGSMCVSGTLQEKTFLTAMARVKPTTPCLVAV